MNGYAATFAVAFSVILGLWLIAFAAVVYHGWLFAAHPWAVRTRRRLFWHGFRAGMPYAWAVPAAVPGGLGIICWGVAAGLLANDPSNRFAVWLAMLGFPLIFIPMFLAWQRVRWFLAPWHRTEVEREAAGLEPLIAMPTDGPQMTMTPREQLFGLGLAAACLVAWWVLESPPFLIGALTVLGLMAAMRVVSGRRKRTIK